MANPSLQANFSANTAGFSQGVSELRQKLNELNTAMETTKQAVRNTNAEIKQYEHKLRQLQQETNNGANANAQQAARMTELRTRIEQITERLGTLRSAEQDLRGQINSTNRALQEEREQISNTNRALQEEREQLDDNSQAASTFGEVLKATLCSAAVQQAVGKLTEGLKSAAAYCYNVGSAFEAEMSRVGAVSGATEDELRQLTDRARELGAQTRFTATEASQAMNYMAMAGWDAQQMLDGIGGVMSLAAAAGGDLALTSDIVTDAITAFGLKASDVAHFSDVLAAASSNANTNVEMMGETFKYCAPLAGALGFSVEDVTEAIGLMANSGIKSTMAGTALRTLFTKLSDEVKITGQNIGEITIQTSNADGSMRELRDILSDMREAFSGLSEAEKNTQAEAVAGKYAMSGFLALMNAGADDVDRLRGAIESCDGSAENMSQTMQDNTAGAVTVMRSALEGLGIAVYDHFGDKLAGLAEKLTGIFSDLTQSIEEGKLDEVFDRMASNLGAAADDLADFAADFLPKAIEGVANLVSLLAGLHTEIQAGVTAFVAYKGAVIATKAIAGIVATIKTVTAAIKTATAGTTLWTAAQEGLNAAIAANPVGAIATAVAALVAGIVLVNGHLDDCNEKLVAMNDRAQELTNSSNEYADKSQALRDVRKRYEEIESSTKGAAEKEQELKALQEELNDQFGMMADNIDLVTGAFDQQAKKIDVLIGKYESLSETDRTLALEKAKSAEKESTAIKLDSMLFSSDNTVANAYFLDRAKSVFSYKNDLTTPTGGTVYFEGTYDERISQLNRLYDEMVSKYAETGNEAFGTIADRLKEQITVLEEGRDTLDALESAAGDIAESASEGAYGGTQQQGYYGGNSTAWKSDADLEAQRAPIREAYYDEEKNELDYLRDIGEITAEEYGRRLTALRDKWLTEGTEKWRAATVAIYRSSGKTTGGTDPNEQAYDDEKAYLKWRLDMGLITEADYYENLAKLRDRYLSETTDKWRAATLELHKYQLKQNQSKLDGIKSQYDEAVSAIDAQIKQRERDREDEELSSQIADIDRQLQYARLDDYSRMQLEKKRRELEQEREDTEWERAREDEKALMGTVYTMAKEAYDEGAADLEAALQTASAVFSAIGTGAQQTASTVSTVNNNSVSMIMNAVSQTSDQIAAAVIKALSSSI